MKNKGKKHFNREGRELFFTFFGGGVFCLFGLAVIHYGLSLNVI